MANLWFWKKRRWFSLLMISYFLILFISIITGALIYNNVINIVEQQSTLINNIILNQVKQEVDLRLKNIKDLIYHIAMDVNVNQFSRVEYPMDTNQRYRIQSIIESFSGLVGNNSIIDDFAVFFPSSQLIITSSSCYGTRDFFEHAYGSNEISYDSWIDIISSYCYGGFTDFKMMKKDFKSTSVITYMQSTNSEIDDVPAASVLVFIDESKMTSIIKELGEIYTGNYMYVLDNNRILFSDSKFNIDNKILMNNYENKTKLLEINNNKFMVSCLLSEYSNLRYYTISSMDYVQKNVNNVRSIILYAGIVYLVLGFIIIFFMAYKSYNPIRRIIELIYLSFNGRKPLTLPMNYYLFNIR